MILYPPKLYRTKLVPAGRGEFADVLVTDETFKKFPSDWKDWMPATLLLPPPPPVPVGKPEPPTRLTVVVPVDVMQESCVEEPTVKANHPPPGERNCAAVVPVAPS